MHDLMQTNGTAILSPVEQTRLGELETVVERGLATFVEVGLALSEIRTKRLYRVDHATFEEYCSCRWGWSAGRARQLVRASSYAVELQQIAGPEAAPQNENATREVMRKVTPKMLRTLPREEVVKAVNSARHSKQEELASRADDRKALKTLSKSARSELQAKAIAESRELLEEAKAVLAPFRPSMAPVVAHIDTAIRLLPR